MVRDFELLEHTADVKLRVYGQTHQDIFTHALQGMFTSMKPKTELCEEKEGRLVCSSLPMRRDFGVQSHDVTALLVDFLSEALYFSDVHNEAYVDVKWESFKEQAAVGTFLGVPVTGFGESEIKAVTYHGMHFKQVNGLWQVDIVFDI